jgi:hypothetical protein
MFPMWMTFGEVRIILSQKHEKDRDILDRILVY